MRSSRLHAEMVIAPGDSEGGPDNRHRGTDQWLSVVAGTGVAIVEGARQPLRAGSLLVIERGERHEIRNTGRGLLKTVNLYCPPAYDDDGDRFRPAGNRPHVLLPPARDDAHNAVTRHHPG